MGYKNLTVSGKTDGFGCQLNAKFSGIAFCWHHKKHRYIHRRFVNVSHGYRDPEGVAKCNWLFPHPNNSVGRKIHVRYKSGILSVFKRPNSYYSEGVLNRLRNIYWSNKEHCTTNNIAVHIRRGDVYLQKLNGGHAGTRWQSNKYYNRLIPKIAAHYPDDMPISIYSEGSESDFLSILNDWDKELIQRTCFKLSKGSVMINWDSDKYFNSVGEGFDMVDTFQEMISSKVLIQSRSGLSYCAGILNSNNVWFEAGNTRKKSVGQRVPLNHWKLF